MEMALSDSRQLQSDSPGRLSRLLSKIAPSRRMGRDGGVSHESIESKQVQPPNPPGETNPSATETSDDANTKYTEAESEAACAKLWAIYVSEAEKYDKRLVESWKGDMDGMLIFSGLYSASLTAFLVESYTTLQPDSGVTNAVLLLQISRQLAAALNGTQIPFHEPVAFHPTTAALVCNILWFLSLALSLTCALLATLVEQWAREFIHKTELRPSPARRVRIHSFLYLGLQKFGMHTVVDIIPLLLHASLISFFAGLVFFLLPVNPLLMKLMSGVLATFLIVYTTLTALPVIFLESPYQTPLSKGLWKFWRFLAAVLTGNWSRKIRSGPYSRLTMTQAMERRSQESPKIRDQHAIQWTVAALTDDSELIPFVEAIPDIVHGAKGFHRANDYLLHPLLYTQEPHLAIWPRVVNLLRSSTTLPPSDPVRIPRLTMCLRAIWALAKTGGEQTISPTSSPTAFYFDRGTFRALEDPRLDRTYTVSVRAAVQHKLLTDLRSHCQYVLQCLDGWELASISSRRLSLLLIRSALDTTLKEGEFYAGDEGYFHLDTESQDIFRVLRASYTLRIDLTRDTPPEEIQKEIQGEIQTLASLRNILRSERRWANAHLGPLSWYLRDSLKAGLCPYEFDLTTQELISCVRFADRSAHVHSAFESLLSISSYSPDIDKMAKIVFRLLPFVDPMKFRSSMNALYHYLLNRNADEATLAYLLDNEYLPRLMSAIAKDVENGAPESCLRTIWLLTSHIIAQNLDQQSGAFQAFIAFTNDLSRKLPAQATPLKSDVQAFVLAIVQWIGIHKLSDEIAEEDAYPSSTVNVRAIAVNFRRHHVLLQFFPENANDIDADRTVFQIYDVLANQISEISLVLLTTFLGAYIAKNRLPSSAQLLRSCLERRPNFDGAVSAEAQRSFAAAILSLLQGFEDNPIDSEFEEVVKNTVSASYYWSWMHDPTCASILLEALAVCDRMGWPRTNSDMRTYIQHLRDRCTSLV
ncbi:hypothetical protein DFH09DRAFT_1383251 [Mycena vulgaris]|nr:hypothetical protein DFH09DRAFT_1383251 [Mycena vulgaris]